jgi:hypothetical protein
MKVIIKDENGNEEIVFEKVEILDSEMIASIISTILFILVNVIALALITSLALGVFVVIFWVIFALWGYFKFLARPPVSSIWDEMIIFDKGITNVIIENKRIRFSDIKEINVIEELYFEGGSKYNIELIVGEANPQKILSDNNYEKSKKFAIKLCKAIGVNGYYIDVNKNSTMLNDSAT